MTLYNPPTLIIRPDLGKRAYRLRCRFVVGAFPSARMLEKAKFVAAEAFVRDLAKQGWDYYSKHGFQMKGPFVPVKPVSLPKRHQQAKWHTPSRDLLPQISAGRHVRAGQEAGYVDMVPDVDLLDDWEFELAGVFIRKTLLVEVPDHHEEQEEMKRR